MNRASITVALALCCAPTARAANLPVPWSANLYAPASGCTYSFHATEYRNVFGYVPDPGSFIDEVAVDYAVLTLPEFGGVSQLPIPTFQDGTSEPTHVMWSVSFSQVEGNGPTPLNLTYNGGTTLTSDPWVSGGCIGTAYVQVAVSAVAYRIAQPTPTRPSSWGSIKSSFSRR